MLCPRCTTQMLSGHDHGVPMHGCPTCGGRFVAEAHLRAVVDGGSAQVDEDDLTAAMARTATSAELPDPDLQVPLPCPSCRSAMRRHVYQYDSGVWVDACAAHGIWLDTVELEQLQAFGAAVMTGMPGLVDQLDADDDFGDDEAGRPGSRKRGIVSAFIDIVTLA